MNRAQNKNKSQKFEQKLKQTIETLNKTELQAVA